MDAEELATAREKQLMLAADLRSRQESAVASQDKAIEELGQHRPIEEVFLELLESKERHLSPSQSNTDKLRDIYIELRQHPYRHCISPPEFLSAIEQLAL